MEMVVSIKMLFIQMVLMIQKTRPKLGTLSCWSWEYFNCYMSQRENNKLYEKAHNMEMGVSIKKVLIQMALTIRKT